MAEMVTMPKLGFDMAEGTLVRWVKFKGDPVEKGEVIAEIETDKATVEVESEHQGVMFRHLAEEDTTLPVNSPIAVIAEEGEEPSDDEIDAMVREAGGKPAAKTVDKDQKPEEKTQKPQEKEPTEEPENADYREEKPEQTEPAPKSVMTGAPGTTIQEGTSTSVTENEQENENDVVLEEENEIADAVSRLGDSFLKGKSLNDLITDQNKLEFKLSNRPVKSIQAAIGINDRFQYIRELFDGDNQKFLETVKTLDSKQNIKEAVDYLRNNFKWKKNETSLKFVNLVKRRFLNA